MIPVPPTTQIFPYLYEIITMNTEYRIHIKYTKSTESACALTIHMEVSSSSSSASRKASSSESTASSVNCVTVSDTDVSVPARKKTKRSTKLTRTS